MQLRPGGRSRCLQQAQVRHLRGRRCEAREWLRPLEHRRQGSRVHQPRCRCRRLQPRRAGILVQEPQRGSSSAGAAWGLSMHSTHMFRSSPACHMGVDAALQPATARFVCAAARVPCRHPAKDVAITHAQAASVTHPTLTLVPPQPVARWWWWEAPQPAFQHPPRPRSTSASPKLPLLRVGL